MAIETCVFCGEKHSTFRGTTIACGNTLIWKDTQDE